MEYDNNSWLDNAAFLGSAALGLILLGVWAATTVHPESTAVAVCIAGYVVGAVGSRYPLFTGAHFSNVWPSSRLKVTWLVGLVLSASASLALFFFIPEAKATEQVLSVVVWSSLLKPRVAGPREA